MKTCHCRAKTQVSLLLAIMLHGVLPSAVADEKAPPRPRLGMNLSGPADWNTELPLVDVFRMSRPWISQRTGAPWGKGPAPELDDHGWVKRLEPGCYAETFCCTIKGGHYPAGDYTLLYEGEGRFNFSQAVTEVISNTPGRIIIHVEPKRGSIDIRLMATTPTNYVRNIRLIMPGFEKTYASNPWHPAFLRRWRGVACLRFMDFQKTNDSKQHAWQQRPTMADATFSERGVPVELLVDLANRLQCDTWFCMPHQADDDYVRNFALVVKQRLAPGLRAWVEYSNEVWNGGFEQNQYAAQQGEMLGFAGQPWEEAWKYDAYRSLQIFDLWEQVFGGRSRLVRVLASQAANAQVARQILSFHDAGHHADALAIAPYFGFAVPAGSGEKFNETAVAEWSVSQVLDHIEQVTLPESVRWMKANKTVADAYGLKLVAYEAGQHLVGIGGAENNAKLTALFESANRNPRMAALYREYQDAWTAAGGDLLCHFSSVAAWSKWGCWGLLEYYDDDEAGSPKFSAVKQWAQSCGQKLSSSPVEQ
jgi:hypothetical protein